MATAPSGPMFDNLRRDAERVLALNVSPGSWPKRLVYLAFDFGFLATVVFRFGKWAQGRRPRPWCRLLLVVYFFSRKVVEAITGIQILGDSEIGPGLVIHQFGPVSVHCRAGRDCTIVQGAQLINRADGRGSGPPVLGDNVFVGAAAIIVGPARVGNNVIIGPLCVVTTDVPDNARVTPPPPLIRPQRRGGSSAGEAPPRDA